MSLINREDTINYLMTNMNWHDEDGYPVEDADEKRAIITDLINGVPDADDGWIPVEKALPDNSDTVLVTHRSGVYIAWYNGRYWERGASAKHREIRTVTAWRPFPPAFKPKEDK